MMKFTFLKPENDPVHLGTNALRSPITKIVNFEENRVFSVISRPFLFLFPKINFSENLKFVFLMNVYHLCFHQKERFSKSEKHHFFKIRLLAGHEIRQKHGFPTIDLMLSQCQSQL